MKKKKTFLYTLKDKDKARQFYHELEYGEKLTLHRVEY